MKQTLLHIGLDYGAKLAGTTAVAMLQKKELQVWQSIKGQDADAWLLKLIPELRPDTVFIDAPLSLPAVYGKLPASPIADYFYRTCDRQLQAMSPMFLGGLTARAIRLTAQLTTQGIRVIETYPAGLARLLFPTVVGYKKDTRPSPRIIDVLQEPVGFRIATDISTWHQVDAVLAWISGQRYKQGVATTYGEAPEGQIIV